MTLLNAHKKIRRIAVSTGGGDCPGLNAVIRAVVKTAIGVYGWEVVGIETGFDGLLGRGGARVRPLTAASVRGILPQGGTILGTSNRGNPFAMPNDDGTTTDRSAEVIERLEELDVDAVITIGGDGSMRIADQMMNLGVGIVGVPKTIDNDLAATDVTFGYDSALHVATDGIDRLHTTAESHHRVMVVEVMGRNAGWIALESGIAGGADVILLPEIPYYLDEVVGALVRRARAGSKFSIVVVSEGAMTPESGPVYQDTERFGTRSDVRRLGGICNHLAADIAEACGAETRATVLGHLQRGGSPSPFDRVLGTRFGTAAVHLVARGGLGRMVALRGTEIVDVPIPEAIAAPKLVDPEGELVKTALSVGVSFGAN
jgi:ATP-dependent phosphofructokinase / diphosphate-dependent phosphofructokinase